MTQEKSQPIKSKPVTHSDSSKYDDFRVNKGPTAYRALGLDDREIVHTGKGKGKGTRSRGQETNQKLNSLYAQRVNN